MVKKCGNVDLCATIKTKTEVINLEIGISLKKLNLGTTIVIRTLGLTYNDSIFRCVFELFLFKLWLLEFVKFLWNRHSLLYSLQEWARSYDL